MSRRANGATSTDAAPGGRRLVPFGWGFVDQGLASATTLAFTIFAGRSLGPHGLGEVVIGLWAYWVVLGFQRSVLTIPHVSASAAAPAAERARATRSAFTICLLGAMGTSMLFLLGGLLPGSVGRALLLFAPWVAAALIQDFWRAILFRDQHPAAAALNEAVWAATLLVLAYPAWKLRGDWAVVDAWGLGAVCAAVLGFAQARVLPTGIRSALGWWRREAWPFGRWLALESAVYGATGWGTIVALTGVIGAAAVGGIRAAQSLFGPLSLIEQAIALPGLPSMVRALGAPGDEAMRLARRLSGLIVLGTAAYVLLMGLGGYRLIPILFGDSFEQYESLWLPVGVWQLATAAGIGFGLYLKALQRGRDLFVTRAVGGSGVLVFSVSLGWTEGTSGAAWGFAVGAALGTLTMIVFAQLADTEHPRGTRPEFQS